MAKEDAEVVEETAQAEVQAPPIPTAEQLNETIAKLTAGIEEAKREAKSHQEYGRKTKEELDRQRGLDTKVSGLETRLEIVTEMMADLMDRGDVEQEEQPKKSRSQEYLARLKSQPQVDVGKQREIEQFRDAAIEADRLVKSVGLEMDKSSETRIAYLLFETGHYEAGLEEVKRLVESKKPKETQETEADIEAKIEKGIRAKLLKDYPDFYKSDSGEPSGIGSSFVEFEQKYIQGKVSVAEYEKRARAEGKLR